MLGRGIGCGELRDRDVRRGAHRNGRFPKSSPAPRWVGRWVVDNQKTETWKECRDGRFPRSQQDEVTESVVQREGRTAMAAILPGHKGLVE